MNKQTPKPVIRTEKRGKKTVTVVSGLHTYGSARLEAICRELKVSLGAGGTVKNGVIEIQGDIKDRAKEYFDRHEKNGK